MNTLNLGSDEIPATKKKSNTRNLKIALGLAAVILVPTIGTTLAGSITVSAPSQEFGQGFTETISCQTTPITITPISTLTEGVFLLNNILVSGIDAACDDKTFTLKVLDDTDTVLNVNANGSENDRCVINFDKDDPWSTSQYCALTGAEEAEFRIAPQTGTTVNAGDVWKITLESSN
jgi:hypothetical protein